MTPRPTPQLYVIAGFLGAGKTTFLKNFLPLFRGRKVALLINEFGREGVDGKLLAGLGAALGEVSGGSAFCTCRIQDFETELGRLLSASPEAVIVEASGLSDPSGVRKILDRGPLAGRAAYRSCICIAGCPRFAKIYKTAPACKKQLASADVLLLNKLDQASPEEKAAALELIKGQRPDLRIIETSFAALPRDMDPEALLAPGTARNPGAALSADINIHSLIVEFDPSCAPGEAEKALAMIAGDAYRMKGFLRLSGSVFFADCVGGQVSLLPSEEKEPNNHLTVLYGHGLSPRKSVEEAVKWYPGRLRLLEKTR